MTDLPLVSGVLIVIGNIFAGVLLVHLTQKRPEASDNGILASAANVSGDARLGTRYCKRTTNVKF